MSMDVRFGIPVIMMKIVVQISMARSKLSKENMPDCLTPNVRDALSTTGLSKEKWRIFQ